MTVVDEIPMLWDTQPVVDVCGMCTDWAHTGGFTLFLPAPDVGDEEDYDHTVICWKCVDHVLAVFGG